MTRAYPDKAMKKFLFLLALPAMVLFGSLIMSHDQDRSVPPPTPDAPDTKVQAAMPAPAKNTLTQFTSLWNGAGSPETEKPDPFDQLWARVILPADPNSPGDDAQDQLRKLAQENPYYLKRLLMLHENEKSAHHKEIIRSLLASIRSREVFALSRQLATSADSDQRMAGLVMLRDLNFNPQEERQLIRLSLNNDQQTAVILQALVALKPPAPATSDTPASISSNGAVNSIDAQTSSAIINQLQSLTHNADPAVRSQSVLQLALWDKKEGSLNYFSVALNDPVASVRQAAIFALAQSGNNADTVKQLLNGVINNASENTAIKTSARQVLDVLTVKQSSISGA